MDTGLPDNHIFAERSDDAEPSATTESIGKDALHYVVDMRKLSKSFSRRTIKTGYTTFKSSLLGLFRKNKLASENVTHAVDDITIRIPQGLAVGIIGKNGAGKSTLLKLMTGIYKPDKGSISVQGRLAALIELGAGFHPDFSGRENIYLAGAMYGLSRKEITERFDTIVHFAELAAVIDDPVRTYSSGMFMRLGFSVAVHTEPDVLLIDEVLAVGDQAFSAKCSDKIGQLKANGKTLFLVSHDLSAIERWSDEVVWLDKGTIKDRGEPRRVIDHYRQFVEKGESSDRLADEVLASQVKDIDAIESHIDRLTESRWGSKEIEIVSVKLTQRGNPIEERVFHPETRVTLIVQIKVNDHEATRRKDLVMGLGIHRGDGLAVFATNTKIEGIAVPETLHQLTIQLSPLGLLDGEFRLDLAVHREDGYPYDYRQGIVFFSVRNPKAQLGVAAISHTWEFSS